MSEYKRELLGLGKGKHSTECHATFKLGEWKLTLGVTTCLLLMFYVHSFFQIKETNVSQLLIFNTDIQLGEFHADLSGRSAPIVSHLKLCQIS